MLITELVTSRVEEPLPSFAFWIFGSQRRVRPASSFCPKQDPCFWLVEPFKDVSWRSSEHHIVTVEMDKKKINFEKKKIGNTLRISVVRSSWCPTVVLYAHADPTAVYYKWYCFCWWHDTTPSFHNSVCLLKTATLCSLSSLQGQGSTTLLLITPWYYDCRCWCTIITHHQKKTLELRELIYSITLGMTAYFGKS